MAQSVAAADPVSPIGIAWRVINAGISRVSYAGHKSHLCRVLLRFVLFKDYHGFRGACVYGVWTKRDFSTVLEAKVVGKRFFNCEKFS